jgi:hypothetical protein
MPVVQQHHVVATGRLTYGRQPYASAMIEWRWAAPGSPPWAVSGFDRGDVTAADGTWRLDECWRERMAGVDL